MQIRNKSNKDKNPKANFFKNNKKLIVIIVIIAVLTFVAAFGTWVNFYYQYGVKPKITNDKAKNIIIMIGDGMGFGHLETTKIFKLGNELIMETLGVHSSVRTRSLSVSATDSAAAATAFATGHKVYNGYVGMSNKKTYQNIFEYAKKQGKKVGFVTTTSAYDATLAGFSAHVKKRSMHEEIVKQQIASDIDVIIGAGRALYDQYEDKIATENRIYCKSVEDLKAAGLDKKVFAILNDEVFASPEDGNTLLENSLSYLVEYAKRLLEYQNDNGFILLIEGAKIDHYSHSNDIKRMIHEVRAFDDAISKMKNFAEENQETFLIVTSDHETGNLKIPKDATKETIDNSWFRSKSHTRQDTPLFASGPGSEEIPRKKSLDNTDIHHIMKSLINNYHNKT